MSRSELRGAAGRMLIAGFDGPTLPEEVRAAIRGGRLGGVILFRRNVDTLEQVAALNGEVYRAAGAHPVLIGVDQEGGRVQRIKAPATVVPSMATLGATGDVQLAASVGELIGAELAALGVNLNFAPVADVFTNPENTVIGDRAFGADPERCGRMAGALALGLTTAGVIPCAKHFPGHGDTTLDSHVALPRVDHDLARLRRIELRPFAMLIRADLPMVMTAHILLPELDPSTPFTLSARGVDGLLRTEMRYAGVVVSDDLEMAAVAARYEIEEMMERGVAAGVDLFLVCHTREKWERAYDALVRLGERSEVLRGRILQSHARLRALYAGYVRPWERPARLADHVGTPAHRALVARFAGS